MSWLQLISFTTLDVLRNSGIRSILNRSHLIWTLFSDKVWSICTVEECANNKAPLKVVSHGAMSVLGAAIVCVPGQSYNVTLWDDSIQTRWLIMMILHKANSTSRCGRSRTEANGAHSLLENKHTNCSVRNANAFDEALLCYHRRANKIDNNPHKFMAASSSKY